MALETGTYISDLVITNPLGSDPKSQGDDHVRLLKSTIKTTFPNVTGAMTKTHTELNSVTDRGLIAGQAWTGTHQFPSTTYGVTAAFGASGTGFATLDFVNAVATNAALPGQTSNAGKFMQTNGTVASWALVGVSYSARTANAILTATDTRYLIDFTANSFTQTFTAAATLGNGWTCYLRNSGTGSITLDPNASELIDGLTSYIMYPGEVRLVVCDGTQFTSVVMHPFNLTFITTGTFVKPPGYQYLSLQLWSGGNSGGKDTAGNIAYGGGGGGYFDIVFPASAVSASTTVTVGAGGTPVSGGPANGNSGGASSFGSITPNFYQPGNTYIGKSVVNSVNSQASFGYEACATSFGAIKAGGTCSTSTSGASMFGGGAGGTVYSDNIAYPAGPSNLGGNGGAASVASNGVDGVAPGGGGGATHTGTQSGAGGRGEVRIFGVA